MAKTVLVIDDEADTVSMLRHLFEDEGYRVLTALGGEEALALLKAEAPDIIILDLMMPGMDGFDFCQALSKSGLARGVPIIVLTALDTFSYSQEFLAGIFGVCLFMYKPFKPATLLENVRQALAVAHAKTEEGAK